ncbi:tryptophan synthase beta subunit-like PLP-dependent enzyme [Fistulina hepatica ATCC 64428]|nr:tryptophan synthase beta subunit-like PLP-dependent enzyme [Fistulina hepatica ATCC 64428]
MASTHLWKETPLLHSKHISKTIGCNAYLKLENLHPSHSFKYRGISHFVQLAKEKHGSGIHIVIASGGNAGLAAAAASRALEVKCTIFIPEGAASRTVTFLRNLDADVVIVGRCYAQALDAARSALEKDANAIMVPAYDDPLVWEGHSTMIDEISRQLPAGCKPDAIVCSVGGAGLLGGIVIGCSNIGWDDVPIVTVETWGSDCFYHSVALNRQGSHNIPPNCTKIQDTKTGLCLAKFSSFTSMASGSLGAPSPAPDVLKMSLKRPGGIRCISIPDELCLQNMLSFADDHKIMVELACAATLSLAYKPSLVNALVPVVEGKDSTHRNIVFIICGGFKVTVDEMIEYRRLLMEDMQRGNTWNVSGPDGRPITVCK